MTTMTTATLAAKGIHKTSRFSQALLHESFTNKLWLSFKIETWNFIKNKLLIQRKWTMYLRASI